MFVNVIESLQLDADYYFQTHTTNPLLKTETINNAIELFLKKCSDYETLFSVNSQHVYDKNGKVMNHNRFKLIPTQDLDPIYEFMWRILKESLMKYKIRIGKMP